MSPLLKSVEAAGLAGTGQKKPHASEPFGFLFTTTEFYEPEFARLIGASQPNRIALIPAVPHMGLPMPWPTCECLPAKRLLLHPNNFPSNYYSWQRLCADHHGTFCRSARTGSIEHRGREWNLRILEAIDNRTSGGVGTCALADGTRFDLQAIS